MPEPTVVTENTVALRKELGLASAISTAVGSMIGSGIFIMPTGTARGGGSVGMTLIMWFTGGLISMCGAMSLAELSTLLPQSGGMYTYLRVTYGNWFGFISAWSSMIIYRSSGVAIIALTFSKYVLTLAFNDGCGDAPESIQKVVAIFLIVSLAALNMYSVKLTARVQVVATAAKVLALCMIVIGGIVAFCIGQTEHISAGFTNTNTDPAAIAVGYYSCLFAYDSWENVLTVSEEVRNVERNMPIVLMISLSLVTVLYTFTNMSYLTVMSMQEMLNTPAVGVLWAERVLGVRFAWILPICVAISTAGSINSTLMASSRLHYAVARDKMWPGVLSMININLYSPLTAILISVLLSCLYIYLGEVTSLLSYCSFINWLFYGLASVAVFVLRFKMSDVHRPFKVFLLLPLIFGLFSLALSIVPLIMNPQVEFLYATMCILAGFIIYVPFVACKVKIPGAEKLTCVLQLLSQSVPSMPLDVKQL